MAQVKVGLSLACLDVFIDFFYLVTLLRDMSYTLFQLAKKVCTLPNFLAKAFVVNKSDLVRVKKGLGLICLIVANNLTQKLINVPLSEHQSRRGCTLLFALCWCITLK